MPETIIREVVKKTSRARKPRRARKTTSQRKVVITEKGAPASYKLGYKSRTPQNKTVTMTGSTNVFHRTVKFKDLETVVHLPVHPSSMPTLEEQSSPFQMYRFKSISATICTDASSSTGGMFGAAFVRDAADDIGDGAAALAVLSAQPGYRQVKIWEPSTKITTKPTKWLYTSDSVEKRLSTQLQLIVLAIGNSTEEVTVSITIDYTVELRERTAAPATATVLAPSIRSGYMLGVRSGHAGLWGSTGTDLDTSPSDNAGDWLDFPFPLASTSKGLQFRFRSHVSMTIFNSDDKVSYLAREIVCLPKDDGSYWLAYPAPIAAAHVTDTMGHGYHWLADTDEIVAIPGNSPASAILANSSASRRVNGPLLPGLTPTWQFVQQNSDLLKAYLKQGLTISTNDSTNASQKASSTSKVQDKSMASQQKSQLRAISTMGLSRSSATLV